MIIILDEIISYRDVEEKTVSYIFVGNGRGDLRGIINFGTGINLGSVFVAVASR